MSMQNFSNWKQKKESSLFRQYQMSRDCTLSRPKRTTKKYTTKQLTDKYLKSFKKQQNYLDKIRNS